MGLTIPQINGEHGMRPGRVLGLIGRFEGTYMVSRYLL